MPRNCAFCQISEKIQNADVVFENEECVIILDKSPIAPAQLLLISKKHHFNFRTMTDQELVGIIRTAERVGAALIREADADGYNLIYSLGACAGQILNHFSIQIIPRRGDDSIVMPWMKTQDFTDQTEKNEVLTALRKRLLLTDEEPSEDIDDDIELETLE